MNKYRFIRESLLEIYEKRDALIKKLCVEIDEASNNNNGKAYYNHLKLLLTEIESLNPFLHRNNIERFPFPPNYTFVDTNFGFKLPISGHDMTSIHSYGYFEPSETVLMQRVAKQARILFDVGANIGYFSFLFKKFTEPDSLVYAFEPENFNFDRMNEAVKENGFNNEIFTYKLAVSDESIQTQLYLNKRGSGGHSLLKVQPDIFTDNFENIETVTLDDFICDKDFDLRNSILKIDIEGAEIKALEGAHKLLASGKPLVIFCEIWKNGAVSNVETIKKIIDYGYTGYSIQKAIVGEQLLKPIFQDSVLNESYNDNYVFIRKENNFENELLHPLKWYELASDSILEHIVTLQENSLIELAKLHASSLFVNHKHLVWFHGDDEAMELIDYYLKHEAERNNIASEGYTYILSNKGWRRKNIIVDYLLHKASGNTSDFGSLFGSYYSPLNINSEILGNIISVLRNKFKTVNILDIVIYAEMLIEQENYDEAELILNEILAYDPTYLEALEDLMVVSILKSDANKANEYANNALSIDGNNVLIKENISIMQNNNV